MWLIIRKPTAVIPCAAAQAMCCSAMSASVQCVATRATLAPSACARRRRASVPMPGSSSAAIRARRAAVLDRGAADAVAVRDLDRVDAGAVEPRGDGRDLLGRELVADGVHAVA